MNNWNANTLLSSIKQYWYLYILLCGWSIYYFVKANTMSIGHDEAGTWLNICKIPFQEFFIDKSKWSDANNHLLNTGAIQLLTHFFSPTLLVLRLPNVLAGILFGITIIRIAQLFQLTIIPAIALFIFLHANPFVVDFFCLARGYGLCVFFAVLSLYYSLLYLHCFQNKYVYKVLVSSFLMIASNFIGIQFLIANCILLFLITCVYAWQIKNWKLIIQHFFILTVGSLIIFLPFFKILQWLAVIGEFNWGTSTIKTTYVSFLGDVMYQNNLATKQIDTLLYILFPIYFVWILIASIFYLNNFDKYKRQLFLVIFPLFMFACMMVLHFIIGAQYPETRKAILYYSTIAMSLYFCIAMLQNFRKGKFVSNGLFLLAVISFLLHFMFTTQKNYNREWWYDVDDYKMIAYAIQQSENKKFSIAAHWSFMPALEYYRTSQFVDKFNLAPYNKSIDTINAYNYYYMYEADTALLSSKYSLDTMFGPGRFLMKHK
jgi:hypothetical protein